MKGRVALAPVCVLGLLLLARAAVACLWDYDTILQERSRFPTALELITGKFLRHSPEFYRWRIADREAKLKVDPDHLAYYDDLAVAYSKTGDHAKAIALMLEKDRKQPGLYETYANLGTFCIFTGDLDQALAFINKALAINPNAHFGREKYQKYLVEYLQSRTREGKRRFPLMTAGEIYPRPGTLAGGFEEFLEQTDLHYDRRRLEHRRAAIEAILGMMRFADYQNPVLLEALADLLEGSLFPETEAYSRHDTIDAKQLSARALLAASYLAAESGVRDEYRRMAERVLQMQSQSPKGKQMSLTELESAFVLERSEADQWYSGLRQDELGWIASEVDPEMKFAERYAADPAIDYDASPPPAVVPLLHRKSFWLPILIPSIAVVVSWLLYKTVAFVRSRI